MRRWPSRYSRERGSESVRLREEFAAYQTRMGSGLMEAGVRVDGP